ncbi:MAG: Cys-tRNA(Pro) deacylase [Synergistaceae bacterium]|jgi:Cys-tRNA(Pro)/Cys-tRNA(Cys) deacylase|nr:Cys-tRNA(Pro) deacylase [Synergistaceae bacterium]
MGRDKKTNAARILDERGIKYELIQFEPDKNDLSAEKAARDIGMPYDAVYKTLVVRGSMTGIMEVCIPAGTELDLKALSALSGNKSASLVPLKEVMPLTGYVRGGCSPIGGKRDYPVYIFEDALKRESIVVNAGARGLMFLMSPRDLIRVTNAVPGRVAKSMAKP